jgi:hypothetical protein
MVGCFHQTFLNGIQSQARALQNNQQVLLGDGPISGMNEYPPTANRLLDLNLCLFANDQSIDQPIHLALDGLIRDRNFLGHGFWNCYRCISNPPAKPQTLAASVLADVTSWLKSYEWNKSEFGI